MTITQYLQSRLQTAQKVRLKQYKKKLGSMFISNCSITLHVSKAFCVHPQEHLETVVAVSGV